MFSDRVSLWLIRIAILQLVVSFAIVALAANAQDRIELSSRAIESDRIGRIEAQVNGLRGDTSISDRTKYDLWYIENWSLLLDVKILIRTALRMFADKNAY